MGQDRVWETYAYYHQLRTQYGRRRPPKIAKQRQKADLQHVEAFLAWCDMHELPPLLFMDKRFEAFHRASRKRAIPRVSQLQSDKLAACWPRVEQTHYGDQQSTRLRAEQQSTARIQVRTLMAEPLPYQEDVKRQQAEHPEACLLMQKYSGGYHPKSSWCCACPKQQECRAMLITEHGFDVVALRTGRFDYLPNHILQAAFG